MQSLNMDLFRDQIFCLLGHNVRLVACLALRHLTFALLLGVLGVPCAAVSLRPCPASSFGMRPPPAAISFASSCDCLTHSLAVSAFYSNLKGAGKTTTLSMMSGMIPISEGDVTFTDPHSESRLLLLHPAVFYWLAVCPFPCVECSSDALSASASALRLPGCSEAASSRSSPSSLDHVRGSYDLQTPARC